VTPGILTKAQMSIEVVKMEMKVPRKARLRIVPRFLKK
jgi:hypothetical protein